VEIFNSLNLSDQDNQNYEKVIEEFEKYVTPKKNEVYERFVFYCRKQEQEERFEHFLTDLRRLAKSCDFKISEEEMIRDRIVLGVNNTIINSLNIIASFQIAVLLRPLEGLVVCA
jgi:hypothetical protein